jgi:hypothetical protein
MIGTIRKHSAALWWSIIPLTIISFVIFMGSGPARNSNGGANGEYGRIYGKKITRDDYFNAQHEFELFYLFRFNSMPEKNPNYTAKELERETYLRLLLARKAEALGIHVGDDQAAVEAANIIGQMTRRGQISLPEFVQRVLQPQGLTAADFKRYAGSQLAIEQLAQAMSVPGVLVTPQEAAAAYAHQHQEISAQIVVFSASNYLSHVAVTPENVSRFYTNYLATYRLPDRVQVDYVEFDVANYLARAKAELLKTNFNEMVQYYYQQAGGEYKNSKSPDEAREKIREDLIHDRAMAAAETDAKKLANTVFSMTPARPENLSTVAKEQGITVKTTAPFSAESGPVEFAASENFTKIAFGLNPDEPFAGPFGSTNALYIIAFNKQLPSEVLSLDQIRARVTHDFQTQQATLLAQRAGTNFSNTLNPGLAAGRSFASICVSAGFSPEVLQPFSLMTTELPGLGDRLRLDDLKQVAADTAVGHVSAFEQTGDGGFILFVQSHSPVNQSTAVADLPRFIGDYRRARANEAFNQWLNTEANRELRNTPLFNDLAPTK